MIRRLYVHNFRCLENFELLLKGQPAALLIGKNGSGKSTVGRALRILQLIGRGTNRIGELVNPSDFSRGRDAVPMRFEIEMERNGSIFEFSLAFELPAGFRELRVLEERLVANGKTIYSRSNAQVSLTRSSRDQSSEARFSVDWHLVALPVIQEESDRDPLHVFKQWLAHMVLLAPVPQRIEGDSFAETLKVNPDALNLAEWFSAIIQQKPAAYSIVETTLRQSMPDLKDLTNPTIARNNRSLFVQFSKGQESLTLPFQDLSDGEKCLVIGALVLAAAESYGPLFCFWDEPDNYLALSEVRDFTLSLRRAFQNGGQFIATSHNPEAIRAFSDENTIVLSRSSHFEPTVVRRLDELDTGADVVDALILGDL